MSISISRIRYSLHFLTLFVFSFKNKIGFFEQEGMPSSWAYSNESPNSWSGETKAELDYTWPKIDLVLDLPLQIVYSPSKLIFD